MLSPAEGQGVLAFVADSAAAEAIRASWQEHGLLAWAKGLFLLDSVWVLVYAPFLAWLIVRLSGEIRADFQTERRLPVLCWVSLLGLLAVVLLAAADLVENLAAIGIIEGKDGATALIPASWMEPAAMLKTSLLTLSLGLVAGLLLLPLGLIMGMPMPLGIRLFHKGNSDVPWSWGVNSATSVLGAIMAVVVAMNAGFNVTLLAGTVLYLIALFPVYKTQ